MLSLFNPIRGIDFLSLLVKLLTAFILGTVIGLERSYHNKPAGFRTHILVVLGATIAALTGVYLYVGLKLPTDPSRIAAGVVTGLGFIGAGTIMVNRHSITGLTTAAGLWAVAGIGMAIGGGLYMLGICATLFVLAGLEILQLVFRRARFHNFTLIYSTSRREAIDELDRELKNSGWHSIAHEIAVQTAGVYDYQVTMTLQRHNARGNDDLLAFVRNFPDIQLEKIIFPR